MQSESTSSRGGEEWRESPHREYDRISHALIRGRSERAAYSRAIASLAELRSSASFRLGIAITSAARSLPRLFSLPWQLVDIWRSSRGVRSLTSIDSNAARRDTAALDDGLRVPVDPRLVAWSMARAGSPATTSALRIAAVLDELSGAALAPDCDLCLLSPEEPGRQLDDFQPHLLLVESAWRGNHGAWRNLLERDSIALLLLLDCCRRRGIPTVFWNKEDPVHFEHFVGVAQLFDHVYTTDQDMAARYRERGCPREASVLRFFCQPSFHNPLRGDHPRQPAACYFGSWYAQYPERGQALASAIGLVERQAPVHIYDRNHGRDAPEFSFPEHYLASIRPSVAFPDVPGIMRCYALGININTVTRSPSMYSRRVHELAACRTTVLTNFAAGAYADYGDSLIYSDDEGAAEAVRSALDSGGRQNRSARALSIAMTHHVARIRLAQLAREVLGIVLQERPVLRVVIAPESRLAADAAIVAFDAVSWPSKILMFVAEQSGIPLDDRHRNDIVLRAPSMRVLDLLEADRDERWFAARPDGLFDPSYLDRAMAAAVYAGSAIVGVAVNRSDLDRSNVPLRADSCLVPPAMWSGLKLTQVVGFEASLEMSGVAIEGEMV